MSKRIPSMCVAVCLAAWGSVVSVAQDGPRQDSPPQGGYEQGGYEIDAAGLFVLLDKNADGHASATEAGAQNERLFRRLLRTSDENADGRLSSDEFSAALQPIRAEKPFVRKQDAGLPGSDALTVVLSQMDANANQRIVRNEVPPKYKELFERMLELADADKNSRLDPREIAREAPRLARLARLAARRLRIDVAAEYARLSHPPTEKRNPTER